MRAKEINSLGNTVVTFRVTRSLRVRAWIAVRLFRLGCWLVGARGEIEERVEDIEYTEGTECDYRFDRSGNTV